jgi:hypothetical protein
VRLFFRQASHVIVLFSVFYDLLVQSAAKLRSATDFKEIISSHPVPKPDDEVHIKPLGDDESALLDGFSAAGEPLLDGENRCEPVHDPR